MEKINVSRSNCADVVDKMCKEVIVVWDQLVAYVSFGLFHCRPPLFPSPPEVEL